MLVPTRPTYTTFDCQWGGPAQEGILIPNPPPFDYGTNPATGTYCPPYRPSTGAVIPGTETYTFECLNTSGGFNVATCADPDLAAQIQAHEDTGLGLPFPECSKDWGGMFCNPGTDAPTFAGLCPVCPPGTLLDDDDCLCWSGDGCPAGECYCYDEAACVSCTPPTCENIGPCRWDADECDWICEGVPECAPDEEYDYATCSCQPRCTEGCWCEETQECVDCDYDPDPNEHDCVWNVVTCEWDCEQCPEGEAWCEPDEECVEAPDPECKEQLNCEWSRTECVWICDDPEVKCSGREWLGEPDCRCESGGGCDLAELGNGWLVRAFNIGGTIYVGISADAGATWDDVEVSTDGTAGESAPSLAVDPWDNIYVGFHQRGPDPFPSADAQTYIWRSDDLGATWIYASEPDESFWHGKNYPALCWTPEYLLIGFPIGVGINFEYSADGGASHGTDVILEALGDAQERRPSIRRDRRGIIHCVYEGLDGDVNHVWSANGGLEWVEPASVLSADGTGAEAGYCTGIERAAFSWWDEGELKLGVTQEDHSLFLEQIEIPMDLPAYQPQQLGMVVDRRETLWLFGLVDDAPEVTEDVPLWDAIGV